MQDLKKMTTAISDLVKSISIRIDNLTMKLTDGLSHANEQFTKIVSNLNNHTERLDRIENKADNLGREIKEWRSNLLTEIRTLAK